MTNVLHYLHTSLPLRILSEIHCLNCLPLSFLSKNDPPPTLVSKCPTKQENIASHCHLFGWRKGVQRKLPRDVSPGKQHSDEEILNETNLQTKRTTTKQREKRTGI